MVPAASRTSYITDRRCDAARSRVRADPHADGERDGLQAHLQAAHGRAPRVAAGHRHHLIMRGPSSAGGWPAGGRADQCWSETLCSCALREACTHAVTAAADEVRGLVCYLCYPLPSVTIRYYLQKRHARPDFGAAVIKFPKLGIPDQRDITIQRDRRPDQRPTLSFPLLLIFIHPLQRIPILTWWVLRGKEPRHAFRAESSR